MPKTYSTFYVRLNDIINQCFQIQTEHGYIDASLLSERTGLSDRIIRDYLKDLVNLRVLDYISSGKYVLNKEVMAQLLGTYGTEPYIQLTLEDFLRPSLLRLSDAPDMIRGKLFRVIKKLNLDLVFDRNIRKMLRETRINGSVGHIIGGSFILPRAATMIPLDNIYIPGSASSYCIRNYGIADYAVLSTVYLSAASYVGYYRKNVLDKEKSVLRVIPDLIHYSGKEPYIPEDPFYEITTEFPEVLDFGRRIAARVLSQITHYKLDISIIEKYGDNFDLYIRTGSLHPHGFVFQAKKLNELQDKSDDLFWKMVKIAREKNVLLVGLTYRIHDNIFTRTIKDFFNLNIAEVSDDNFLTLVLEEGDTTALIVRGREKGRPDVPNWYEFYMKARNNIIKFEFIARDNPWDDMELIRDVVYSSFILGPARNLSPGPGSVVTAQIEASKNVQEIERITSGIIRSAFIDHFNNLRKEKERKRRRDALGK